MASTAQPPRTTPEVMSVVGLISSLFALGASIGYVAVLLLDLGDFARTLSVWVFFIAVPVSVVSCLMGLRSPRRARAVTGLLLTALALLPMVGMQFVFGV